MKRIFAIFWRNAAYQWGDGGLTGWGWFVVVILAILLILFVIYKLAEQDLRKTIKQEKKIKSLGYSDLDDIEVFCERIDCEFADFIKSKGIRKQYELFSEGKSSEFIKIAETHKKTDEANSDGYSSGLVTGIAVGTAVGTAINNGNR